MGKKGSWFYLIKKTLSLRSKRKKTQKSVNAHHSVRDTIVENVGGSGESHQFPPPEEVKPIVVEDQPPENVFPVASASCATATSAVPAAIMTPDSGKSREEVAAIRIQTRLHGYLARRAQKGSNVKCQTANTLKCTKSSLDHLQSKTNSRRFRMSDKNQARQKLNSAATTPRSKPGPSQRANRPEANQDDDTKNIVSVQSERNSVAGTMVKNGESLPDSAAHKHMMVAKSAAKVKSRAEGLPENSGGGRNTVVGSAGNFRKQLNLILVRQRLNDFLL